MFLAPSCIIYPIVLYNKIYLSSALENITTKLRVGLVFHTKKAIFTSFIQNYKAIETVSANLWIGIYKSLPNYETILKIIKNYCIGTDLWTLICLIYPKFQSNICKSLLKYEINKKVIIKCFADPELYSKMPFLAQICLIYSKFQHNKDCFTKFWIVMYKSFSKYEPRKK